MLRVGEPCHPRTGTAALVGGLAIGCRIRETLVVEYPIGIQPSDATLKSVEMDVSQRRVFVVETFVRTELEVATRFPIIEVDAEFGTIDVERHFFLLGLIFVVTEEVFHIERVPQEYPSPAEVDAEFGA